MKCAVLIPVGPGHERLVGRALHSVRMAWAVARGPFTSMSIETMPDPLGELGRSAARNRLMDQNPADFHFLLDADDSMMVDAFRHIDVNAPATFGGLCLSGRPYSRNVHPVTRETLLKRGAHGTLCMGCFVRGDLGLRFNEAMDVAEDFDFYLRLPGFTKRKAPLVSIGYNDPSAGGPRGYDRIRWVEECNKVIDRYRGGVLA